MEEYRRRLERIQINICVVLTLALFGGLLILPRIGQIIWIAIIAAVYVRLTLVIAKREELLEKLQPSVENNERSVMYDTRERRINISYSKESWILGVDPKNDREATEIVRQVSSSSPGESRTQERSTTNIKTGEEIILSADSAAAKRPPSLRYACGSARKDDDRPPARR
jgi:hypothetical protein